MATECFCGCGLDVAFGRRRVANKLGAEVDKSIAIVRGALHVTVPGFEPARLEELAAEGEQVRQQMRARVHGEIERDDVDTERVRRFTRVALDVRAKLAGTRDFVGLDPVQAAQLFATGMRAAGAIVTVQDTGSTLNQNPRVRIRIRVAPEGQQPFELEGKVTVSRVAIPRPGDRVTIAYDPADRERFAFVASHPSAPPEPSAAAELERLARLRASGALTDEEFARAKARVLGD